MVIEGLKSVATEQPINQTDQVGSAVEALNLLGLIEDRERVEESVKAGFSTLDATGVAGENFIHLAGSSITLPEFIAVLDNNEFAGRQYPQTYIDHEIWDQYGQPQPDGQSAQARSAVQNLSNPEEPLLHFLNRPFDEKSAGKDDKTQLDSLAEAAQTFAAEFPDFNMLALDHMDVAFIALMRRIKGEDMPMEWGYMRDATLPRVEARGDSWVGCVDSSGGQLGFSATRGRAHPTGGVGLSVGQTLEPQAS